MPRALTVDDAIPVLGRRLARGTKNERNTRRRRDGALTADAESNREEMRAKPKLHARGTRGTSAPQTSGSPLDTRAPRKSGLPATRSSPRSGGRSQPPGRSTPGAEQSCGDGQRRDEGDA